MFISALLTLLFQAALAAEENPHPHISSTSTETSYRIERNFAQATKTQRVLHRIVHEGVEEDASNFDQDAVAVFGDSGIAYAKQLQKDQFALILQSFISNELVWFFRM